MLYARQAFHCSTPGLIACLHPIPCSVEVTSNEKLQKSTRVQSSDLTLSNHTKRKLVSDLISALFPLILVRTCQRVSQSFHFTSRRLLSARSTRQSERKTINKLSLSYRCGFSRSGGGENKKRSVSPSPPMIYDPINKIKFHFLRPAAATAEKETAWRSFLGLQAPSQ